MSANSNAKNCVVVPVISTPFPWSPLKLHSMEWEWSWSGNGVRNLELFRDYCVILKKNFITNRYCFANIMDYCQSLSLHYQSTQFCQQLCFIHQSL
jgi:hypothetical protein